MSISKNSTSVSSNGNFAFIPYCIAGMKDIKIPPIISATPNTIQEDVVLSAILSSQPGNGR